MEKKRVIHPLAPIVNADSRILILGSFPSVVSREKKMYYANPSNRFWKVMSGLFKEEIEDRVSFCLKHHIALWDVIHSCVLSGSSDASITQVEVNSIQELCEKTQIHTIFTTGKKAYELYEKYVDCDMQAISLPSTSGANARMRLEDLMEAYQVIKEALNEEN